MQNFDIKIWRAPKTLGTLCVIFFQWRFENRCQIKCVKFFSDTQDSSSKDELIQESNVQQHGANYFDKNYYQNRNWLQKFLKLSKLRWDKTARTNGERHQKTNVLLKSMKQSEIVVVETNVSTKLFSQPCDLNFTLSWFHPEPIIIA